MAVSVALMIVLYSLGVIFLQKKTLTKEKQFLGHVMILLGSCFLLWNLSELIQVKAIFRMGTAFFWIVLAGVILRGYQLQGKN